MSDLDPYGVQTTPFIDHTPTLTRSAKDLMRNAGWATMESVADYEASGAVSGTCRLGI
jgi:hypothetical protein